MTTAFVLPFIPLTHLHIFSISFSLEAFHSFYSPFISNLGLLEPPLLNSVAASGPGEEEQEQQCEKYIKKKNREQPE